MSNLTGVQTVMVDCSQVPNRLKPTNICYDGYQPRNTGFNGCLYLPSDRLRLYQPSRLTRHYRMSLAEMIRRCKKNSSRLLLNSCAMDSFMLDPSLIPADWLEKRDGMGPHIIFAGTIWERSNSQQLVNVLTLYPEGGFYTYAEYLGDERAADCNCYLATIIKQGDTNVSH